MQLRSWKQALARSGGALSLFGVLGLALTTFAPSAFSALAPVSVPSREGTPPAAVAQGPVATTEAVLQDWQETATKKKKHASSSSNSTQATNRQVSAFLKSQAQGISVSLAKQVQTLAMQLSTLTPGSNQYLIVQQELALADAEAAAFSAAYKKNFGKGASANLPNLQALLIGLQVQFMSADTQLTLKQTTQIQQTGSVGNNPPPTFTF